jgi:hypothetical protein
MKMKPILFSGSMVRAILEDRKSMTRRVIKPQPERDGNMWRLKTAIWPLSNISLPVTYTDDPLYFIAPHLHGDVLWVRETWKVDASDLEGDSYVYRADDEKEKYPNNLLLWRPSIFMPREAARIFLRVTDVRVERLQEITPEDARREGCEGFLHINPLFGCAETIKNFQNLWDGINAKRGYAWSTNPWVWAYSFERISKEEAERSVA